VELDVPRATALFNWVVVALLWRDIRHFTKAKIITVDQELIVFILGLANPAVFSERRFWAADRWGVLLLATGLASR